MISAAFWSSFLLLQSILALFFMRIGCHQASNTGASVSTHTLFSYAALRSCSCAPLWFTHTLCPVFIDKLISQRPAPLQKRERRLLQGNIVGVTVDTLFETVQKVFLCDVWNFMIYTDHSFHTPWPSPPPILSKIYSTIGEYWSVFLCIRLDQNKAPRFCSKWIVRSPCDTDAILTRRRKYGVLLSIGAAARWPVIFHLTAVKLYFYPKSFLSCTNVRKTQVVTHNSHCGKNQC